MSCARFLFALLPALLAVACSGSSDGGLANTNPSGGSCTPGQQIACPCASGNGVQRCRADGRAFDSCECGGNGGSGGTSAGGTSAGGTSAGGTSAGGTSAGGTSAGGTSAGGTSAGGTSSGGQTSAGSGGASGGGSGAGGGTSFTCADAAAEGSNLGCEFWPTVTPNLVWSIFDFAVGVSNPGIVPANVVVERGGAQVASLTLAAGTSDLVYLPWVKDLKGSDADECGTVVPDAASTRTLGGAYRLTSTAPVAAFQFSAWQYQSKGGPPGKSWAGCPGDKTCATTLVPTGCFSFSNDASLLLPTATLGTIYTAIGPTGWDAAKLPTSWTLTATEDGTDVTALLGPGGSIAGGTGVPMVANGGTFQGTLARGEVLLVRAGVFGADLSGAAISASKPVQLITSMGCVQVPLGSNACDHVEETVLPRAAMGNDYVVPVPTGPGGKVVGHMVRFVGIEQTTLTFEGAPGAPPPATLAPGQMVELKATQAFRVTGDKPFAVMTFLLGGSAYGGTVGEERGDPAMTFPVPRDRRATRLAFVVPSEHEEVWVDVVSKAGATVLVDGAPITAAPTSLPGGDQLHRGKLTSGKVGHTLSSPDGLTAQVLAYGKYTGVAYPAGLGKKAP